MAKNTSTGEEHPLDVFFAYSLKNVGTLSEAQSKRLCENPNGGLAYSQNLL